MSATTVFDPAHAGDEPTGPGLTPKARPGQIDPVESIRRRLVRLGFDVHDGPMQDLVALAWGLQSARQATLSVFERLAADLAGVEKGLRALMTSALDNDPPRAQSFCVPVEEHIATFKERTSAAVSVSVTGAVEPRTDSQRIALERVLRESLSNIAKHADAERVEVCLHGDEKTITLEIWDDGCGFDTTAQRDTQHIGLNAMRELLELIGGSLTIASRPGGPTTVIAQVHKWEAPQSSADPAPAGPGDPAAR
jgi:signal transduction histidine kinase